MPVEVENVKAEGIEALQRLLQLVAVRQNCIAGVDRCEGRAWAELSGDYADWVVDLAKTNAEIKEALPAAFAFLLDLKREVGR